MSNGMEKLLIQVQKAKEEAEKKKEAAEKQKMIINNNANPNIKIPNDKKKKEKTLPPLKVMQMDEYLESGIGASRGFLVDRLIPKDGVGLICAPEKCNKTTLAYNIALGVAQGKDCLGHTTLEQGKVLYIVIEGSIHNLANTFGKDNNIDVIQDYHFQIEERKEDLKELIKANEYKLVIIDSLYKATKGNSSNAHEIREPLIYLEELAAELHTTFLIPHHTGRREQGGELNADSIAGSKHITRSVSFTLLLDFNKDDEKKEDNDLDKDALLTDEEYDAKPKQIIMKKILYRFGGEGFPTYDVDIFFKEGKVVAKKRGSTGFKVPAKDRKDILYDHAYEILQELEVPFTSKDLASKLALRDVGLTMNTIKRDYIADIIVRLKKNDVIEESKRYNFISKIVEQQRIF